MKRWRRPLILIALLLLAGAVVNLAVAWGIAAFRKDPPSLWTVRWPDLPSEMGEIIRTIDGRTSASDAPPWHARLRPVRGAICAIRARPGMWFCEEQDLHTETGKITMAFGWPFPAIRHVAHFDRGTGAMSDSEALPAPPFLSKFGLFSCSMGRVPIGPIAPGLLYGSLLYAAILSLPLTFFPIRRHLRARRGRCRKCGYDLAGLAEPAAPCPECGAVR